jgi:hypothetical protein
MKLNLKVNNGATFSRIITWKQEDGTRQNLTGYTALMQVRDRHGGNIILSLSTSNGLIELETREDSEGETQGTIYFEITDEMTVGFLNQRDCVYDLLLSSSGGQRYRLIEGTVTFSNAVSIPT